MALKKINCCPNCKKATHASEYLNHPLGSVLPTIRCPCGYSGLPVEVDFQEYLAWAKNMKGDDR